MMQSGFTGVKHVVIQDNRWGMQPHPGRVGQQTKPEPIPHSVQDRFAVRPVRFGHLNSTPPWVDAIPYGAHVSPNGVQFKLSAPDAERVTLVKIKPKEEGQTTESSLKDKLIGMLPGAMQGLFGEKDEANIIESARVEKKITMHTDGKGTFYYQSKLFEPGSLYMYRIKYRDGAVSKLLPDPRSRFQPEDVHGPSQVISPEFPWEDQGFQTPKDIRQLVPTRIHIGTFTPEGTFKSAIEKLDYIKNSGYNAIEVMPIMEFPGRRNWGYDMVGWFAVENSYGTPEDFKRFVNEAHKRGIAVFLDVVYNHIGPEGNYFSNFDRGFVSYGSTPWGDGFNFNNPRALEFVKDNAVNWVKEFHVDGFRFDMTKFIPDHVTREITGALYMTKQDVINMAEDGRNHNNVTMPHDWEWKDWSNYAHKGLGFHGQWNFDFHHAVQSVTTGHSHMGAPTHVGGLADVLEKGFRWPDNNWMRELEQAVNFSQSHDEIGNWDGKRIHSKVPLEKAKVTSMLKYVVPGIPLSFMGEEYGEKNPFYFFVDHSDPVLVKAIEQDQKNKNSPQPPWTQPSNFMQSKLSWQMNPGVYRMNQDMINLRKTHPALWQGGRAQMKIDRSKLGSNTLFIHRWGKENPQEQVFVAINMSGFDYKKDHGGFKAPFPEGRWVEVLNTDDAKYEGKGLTNSNFVIQRPRHSDEPAINLPAWSISIFKKVG